MKKPKTVSKAKKEAWKAFSKYIRLRDCLKTKKSPYEGRCITCHKVFPTSELQAGHFIAGRNNSILLHEQLVSAQCRRCNIFLNGNLIEYYPVMLRKYGKKKIDEWKKLSNQSVQYKVVDWEDKKGYYESEYAKLLKKY